MSDYNDEVDRVEDRYFRGKKMEKDPEIYSTLETVFDEKTRLILFKYIQQGLIDEVGGAISTGKEANVYYCMGEPPLACKIYRIESPSFKKMKQYVEGDFRFKKYRSSRVGFITAWAKKEFKNLKRLQQAGISVPKPVEVERNVLFLEYLGTEDAVLPQLQEARVDSFGKTYREIMEAVKAMYRKSRLIHGDLSGYNILFDEEIQQYYIIDVSQSVLNDHPEAENFLIRDIYNLNTFFQSRAVDVIEIGKLYQWVTGDKPDEGKILMVTGDD